MTALASFSREVANQLLALTARELTRKQDHVLLLLSTTAQERVICFLIDMVQRASPSEGLIVLPMFRQDIADYLGLTVETVSRTLCDLERRGAIEISGRRSIMLSNQFAKGRGERPAELFEGVKGRRPKTEEELEEWLFSPEGKAATQFNLTSLSRWGGRDLRERQLRHQQAPPRQLKSLLAGQFPDLGPAGAQNKKAGI